MLFLFSFRKATFATCKEDLSIVFIDFLMLPFTSRLIFGGDQFFRMRSLGFLEFIV
jgi:hypothetical protein